MFHVGDVLRKLREKAGFTLEEVARQTGMSKGTISQIERGEGNPRQSTLDDLAKFYGLSSAAELYRISNAKHAELEAAIKVVETALDESGDRSFIDVSGYKKNDLPVIAEGEATPIGSFFWDNPGVLRDEVEKRMSRPADVRDSNAYGVVVRGDSMEPMFRAGMRLIVSPNIPVGDGDPAYVQLRSGERLVKLVTRSADGYVLESVNPQHRPRFVRQEEIEHVHRIAYARFLR